VVWQLRVDVFAVHLFSLRARLPSGSIAPAVPPRWLKTKGDFRKVLRTHGSSGGGACPANRKARFGLPESGERLSSIRRPFERELPEPFKVVANVFIKLNPNHVASHSDKSNPNFGKPEGTTQALSSRLRNQRKFCITKRRGVWHDRCNSP
jgi:hypothetical protein